MTRLKAIIFDCDGVIADSEPLHFASLQRVLAAEGIALDEETYTADYLALDDRGAFTLAFRRHGMPLSAEKLRALMDQKAAQLEPVMRTHLTIFAGVPEFVRAASASYPLAVASGALRHEIELILRHAQIRDCFGAVISAEDVTRGKPDPESFIRAHATLNASSSVPIDPGECLVIEDSIYGVEAARLAGMRVLAVTNSYSREQLLHADGVIDSFVGLTTTDIEQLVFGGQR